MEQLDKGPWKFDVAPGAMVVTTSYVIEGRMPVLHVSHEIDDEREIVWQFHCGNDDYTPSVLRLVRLDEILAIAPELEEVASVPVGSCARRQAPGQPWIVEDE